jgi:hypothetical protein
MFIISFMLFEKILIKYQQTKHANILSIIEDIEALNMDFHQYHVYSKKDIEKFKITTDDVLKKLKKLTPEQLLKSIKYKIIFPLDYYKHTFQSSPSATLFELIIERANEKIIEAALIKLDSKKLIPDLDSFFHYFFLKKTGYLRKYPHLTNQTSITHIANLITQYLIDFHDSNTNHKHNYWSENLRSCLMSACEHSIYIPLYVKLLKKGIKPNDDTGLIVKDMIVQKNIPDDIFSETINTLDNEYIKKGIIAAKESIKQIEKLSNLNYQNYNHDYQSTIEKLEVCLEKSELDNQMTQFFSKSKKKQKI